MSRFSFAALVLIPLLMSHLPARAGTNECGLFADSLLALPDTLSKFYPIRPGIAGQDLIWRDLEFMWDSLYTNGSGASLADRVKMRTLAENLVEVLGKNPFTPGPGANVSDFQLAYDFFRATGGHYTQAPGDTALVLLGNYDRLIPSPYIPTNYNPSDRSHLDVYLVHSNHPDPTPQSRLLATCPSEFVADDEDLTTGHVNDPKPANSIQVVLGSSAASDTLWTSHNHIAARTVLHEMQHGFPATERGPSQSEMFSQGTEVVVGMTAAATAEAHNGEVPYSWGIFDYGDGPLSCSQVTSKVGLNYELRSLFTAYLAFNLPGADNTLTDDLLRRWARSGRQATNLRDLMADSCVTCATASYFPTGAGGSALDNTTRLAMLHHFFRVAVYANDTTLAQGQYGYPPRFGFSPADHYRIWQAFDECDSNDIVAIPPELTVDESHLVGETVLAGTRSFGTNTTRVELHRFGAEYWVLRSDPELFGTSHTLRVAVAPDGICPEARMMVSLIGYSPPDTAVATGALWSHPEWATAVSAPVWMTCDSLRQPIEASLAGFGSTYKAVVAVITLGESTDIPRMDYRMSVTFADHLVAPQPPSSILTTGAHESAPTWDPSGDEVALVRSPTSSGVPQIYRQPIDGSTPSPLTAASPRQQSPDWSPRGDWVVYSEHYSTTIANDDLHMHNVNTGVTQPLVASPDHDMLPAFSPNGQQVAYVRLKGSAPFTWSLARLDLDGANHTTVCTLPSGNLLSAPRWSPNGEFIYFARHDTLWAVASTGGTPVAVHAANGKVRDLDFSLGNGPLMVKMLTFPPEADSV